MCFGLYFAILAIKSPAHSKGYTFLFMTLTGIDFQSNYKNAFGDDSSEASSYASIDSIGRCGHLNK